MHLEDHVTPYALGERLKQLSLEKYQHHDSWRVVKHSFRHDSEAYSLPVVNWRVPSLDYNYRQRWSISNCHEDMRPAK